MTKRARTIIVEDEIYRFSYMVVRGGTLKNALKRFFKWSRTEPERIDGDYDGYFYCPGESLYALIYLDADSSLGILAHECVHAAKHVLEHLDIKSVTPLTEESLAHYVRYLFDKIHYGK